MAKVSNNQETSCGRHGGCTTTDSAQVTATLAQPVDGQRSTVVNIPGNVSYTAGQPISILVDPKEPGYAELPGQPYSTSGAVVGVGVLVVILFLAGGAALRRAVRMRRRGPQWYHQQQLSGRHRGHAGAEGAR